MSDSDGRGNLDDRVRLQLGGQEIKIAEHYSVVASILSQPARWSLRMGYGGVISDLLLANPPGTPFALNIGSTLQQSGFVDGYTVEQSVGASEVTFLGRDALAPLQSSHVDFEKSYSNITYADLVGIALDAVAQALGVSSNLVRKTASRIGVKLRLSLRARTRTAIKLEIRSRPSSPAVATPNMSPSPGPTSSPYRRGLRSPRAPACPKPPRPR